MKKSKLSLITASALSLTMLMQGSLAYAAPVSATSTPKLFTSVAALKTLNNGKAPKIVRDKADNFAFLDGAFTNIKVKSAKDAINSIQSVKSILGIASADCSFSLTAKNEDDIMTSYRLQQLYKGVRVYGREVVVATDATGKTTSVCGNYAQDINVSLKASVSKETANKAALKSFDAAVVRSTELVIYSLNDVEPTLCYQVTLSGSIDGKSTYMAVFVDANKGSVVAEAQLNATAAATGRGTDLAGKSQTFNCYQSGSKYYLYDTTRSIKIYQGTGNNIPGSWITSTSTTFSDKAAVSAMVNIAKTYDYYKNVQGRNSYDGKGGTITATIHYKESSYGKGYDNAFWTDDGNQFVFGDGYQYFTPLTGALDVTAHEFTHAIISRTCDLAYQNQSGAMNEAYADIMGQIIEGDNDSEWLLGEDVCKSSFGRALRNMSNPEEFQQPSKVGGKYYVSTSRATSSNDWGGVHTNSGIINKAAYLMWKNGLTKDEVADVFYHSLFKMNSNSNFVACKAAVLSAAKDLGLSSAKQTAITNAFTSVGVN